MILGMSPLLFVHVALSLVGIATGLVVFYGLLTGKSHGGLTAVFLATTVLTSLTGFPLPATQILPSHIFGVVSLLLLAVAIVALYTSPAGGDGSMSRPRWRRSTSTSLSASCNRSRSWPSSSRWRRPSPSRRS